MWLPTTPFSSTALPPALLRVWGLLPFPRGFSGCDGMDLLSSPLTYSPVIPPFWSRMETTWPSPLSPACWQWLKTFLKTTGTAAKLTWTYLLIRFLTKLMYIPSQSLVRPIQHQESLFIHCMKYWGCKISIRFTGFCSTCYCKIRKGHWSTTSEYCKHLSNV